MYGSCVYRKLSINKPAVLKLTPVQSCNFGKLSLIRTKEPKLSVNRIFTGPRPGLKPGSLRIHHSAKIWPGYDD
jgi:hypothetical protein